MKLKKHLFESLIDRFFPIVESVKTFVVFFRGVLDFLVINVLYATPPR